MMTMVRQSSDKAVESAASSVFGSMVKDGDFSSPQVERGKR